MPMALCFYLYYQGCRRGVSGVKVGPLFTCLGRAGSAVLTLWIILTSVDDLYLYGCISLSLPPEL